MSQFKDWWGHTFHGKRIALLGLKQAGKSQFLKSLGCSDARPGTESQEDTYRWFKVSYPNKSVYVKAGYDRGGGLEFFKENFAKQIKNSDYVLFVIDVYKYFNGNDVESNKSYRQHVAERLDFINLNVSNRFVNKFAIVLTHADLMTDPESKLINDFQRLTKERPYEFLSKQCYAVNATKEEEVLKVFKRIVGV